MREEEVVIDPEFESMIMVVVKCDPIPRHGMRRRSGFVRTSREPKGSNIWLGVGGVGVELRRGDRERRKSERPTDRREGVWRTDSRDTRHERRNTTGAHGYSRDRRLDV